MGELKRLDTTAITVVDSSPAPIMASIRDALSNALGYDVDNADPWMVVAASLMPYFVQSRALADVAAKASNLAFATGETLEALAAGHGLYRLAARAAVIYTYICIGDWGDEITEGNAGTLIITSLVFVKKDEAGNVLGRFEYGMGSVRFNVGATWIQIPLYCTETGPEYNGLTDFVMDEFDYVFSRDDNASNNTWCTVAISYDPNNNVDKIISIGGANAETDDEFAQRVYNEIAASNAAGSVAYYKAAALRVPGIIDVRVLSKEEAIRASQDVFGQIADPATFDGYDVIVIPLAEEAGRGTGEFLTVPIQVSVNTALYLRLGDVLNQAAIVGSNVMIFPAFGILQLFSNVYRLQYYLYQSDVNEFGISEMTARIQFAFEQYKHWQCDTMDNPYSIGELIKTLITAGAAKIEMFDINGDAAGSNDALYLPMYSILFAARKFGRYDATTQTTSLIDSLVLEYGGTLEKVKGYL